MGIRTVLSALKQAAYLKSVVRVYKDVLVPGNYQISDSFRSAALKDEIIGQQAKPYFYKPNANASKKKCAAFLNSIRYLRNGNENSRGEYEAFYTANNYDKIREIKLFSFQNKKILTVCTSAEEREKQLRQYETYAQSYRMPRVKKSEQFENAYEVAMIELCSSPGEEAALKAIARATACALGENGTAAVVRADGVTEALEEDTMKALLSKISSKADPTLLEYAWPTCVQHGDLSKENLIYGLSEGQTDYWFIDWEHARERVFFYDWFFYMVNSAMYYDDTALRLYLGGETDALLGELFARFGMSFEAAHRKDYLVIFMLLFLKERVCDRGNVAALRAYDALLNRYI